ncbi:MAG: hypothetical protein PHU40_07730 [Sulfurimonas sp.]|nr:hypothetical protein [Sulfurimonas sp.]
MKKAISLLGVSQLIILLTYFYSFTFYMNLQVAFITAAFIMFGSMFAYKKMIQTQIDTNQIEEKRDLLDEIEDPYELYDETPLNEAPYEELNLREIVKEEKKKIKTFSLSSAKHGARGSVSAFRLIPYVFLVLGFIALKNNNLLDIPVYLVSLLPGMIIGYLSAKEILK